MMTELAIGIVVVFMLSIVISQWNERERNDDE
jgi:Sec-independent protein secretion pathway component TatC